MSHTRLVLQQLRYRVEEPQIRNGSPSAVGRGTAIAYLHNVRTPIEIPNRCPWMRATFEWTRQGKSLDQLRRTLNCSQAPMACGEGTAPH